MKKSGLKACRSFVFFLSFVFLFCAAGGGQQLPSSFDLRNVEGRSYVTPVKSQMVPGEWWNNVGLCWAFASVSSFEGSLLMQGITNDPKAPLSNLSAWHLGNYNGYNNPIYEFNNQTIPNSSPPVPVSYNPLEGPGWGASGINAIDYLSFAPGLVLEHLAPIPLKEMKARKTLSAPRYDLPAYYMLRKGLIYHSEDFGGDEHYRSVIKTAAMNYGPVVTFMYLGIGDFSGQSGSTFWRDENFTEYYCDNEEFAGLGVHAVAVVGWDDERYISGAPGRGAWLARDSLGEDFHDGGYFWISFYDAVFLKEPMFGLVFVADSGKGYGRTVYRTHSGALSRLPIEGALIWEYLSEGFNHAGLDSWGAARFTARGDDLLKAVGLVTVNRNENISIRVYGGWDDEGNRPDELLFSDNVFIEETGYHVIDLSAAVSLVEGHEFVIAAGFLNRPGGEEPLVIVRDMDQPPLPEKSYMNYFDPGSGWGSWMDLSSFQNGSVFYVQGITGGSDSGCFIATSAYGSPVSYEVSALRDFREGFLAGNTAGRAFINMYYKASPPLAEILEKNGVLRFLARAHLSPIVKISGAAGAWK